MNELPEQRDLGIDYDTAIECMRKGMQYLYENRADLNISPQILALIRKMHASLNICMADNVAMGRLLIEKGVFTPDEYKEYVRVGANEEVAQLQDQIERLTKTRVDLARVVKG